jgi:hypothetical protein
MGAQARNTIDFGVKVLILGRLGRTIGISSVTKFTVITLQA